jgi:flavin-dependent dehydrogenase
MDVLIAGGGVAGASLAVLLGRAGYRVRLFEKARVPRDKVCGEGLMPAGVSCLHDWGIPVEGREFQGVRYHKGALTAPARFARGHGLGVRRVSLDATLFQEASRHAEVREGARVDSLHLENGRVAGLVVQGEIHRAPLTVAADGVHSPLRRSLAIPVAEGLRRFALRAHFQARWDGFVDVFWGREHEVYVTPLPDGVVSVALLALPGFFRGTPAEILRHAIGLHPALQEKLRDAPQLEAPTGASKWHVTPSVRHLPGLLLHGDAAGYIDPITGGGMTQALLSSRLIARHLRDGIPASLAALDRDRQSALRGYRLLTRTALWLAGRPAVSMASFQLLRSWPGLFSQLLSIAGSAK